eukprot:scaffold5910_cov103-Isochrysis_galbana.AAC.8
MFQIWPLVGFAAALPGCPVPGHPAGRGWPTVYGLRHARGTCGCGDKWYSARSAALFNAGLPPAGTTERCAGGYGHAREWCA